MTHFVVTFDVDFLDGHLLHGCSTFRDSVSFGSSKTAKKWIRLMKSRDTSDLNKSFSNFELHLVTDLDAFRATLKLLNSHQELLGVLS